MITYKTSMVVERKWPSKGSGTVSRCDLVGRSVLLWGGGFGGLLCSRYHPVSQFLLLLSCRTL